MNENRTTKHAPSHGNGHGRTLAGDAAEWPTPNASAEGGSRSGDQGDELLLGGMARQWPTPAASNTNDGEDPDSWRARAERLKEDGKNGNGAGTPLAAAAAAVTGGTSLSRLLGPPAQTTSKPGSSSPRVLNPRFVESLMGFPQGWTELELTGSEPSGTQSCPSKRPSRSERSQKGSRDDNAR